MITVWKLVIDLNGPRQFSFEVPRGYDILSVGPDPYHFRNSDFIAIWIKVDDEAPKENALFNVYGTGQQIFSNRLLDFVGTVVFPQYAWHVFRIRQA